ncbi:O-antigen ligase family protein, partial [Flavobacteriales bacterium]|nr:O-antigen ligase family protein [Flavobacteriales bacterium]
SCIKLPSIKKRLHQIFFEFENKESGFSSNGHSITQRLNFSYTGILIAKENFLLGVGTGDVPDAFDAKHIELNSRLATENRKRGHNQFLTLFIAFGIVGFLIWIISFTYPILKTAKDRYVYGAFLVISLISFLGDDTLETQAGVTLFAFFNSFFLFHSLHKAGR